MSTAQFAHTYEPGTLSRNPCGASLFTNYATATGVLGVVWLLPGNGTLDAYLSFPQDQTYGRLRDTLFPR